jgi:Na+/melibiose symporter-like transporter
MLDLTLFSNSTVRGAAIAQVGTSIAMAGVLFALILHFQYAYGWSPVRAGLANLPLILTMIGATPISEFLAKRFGHRIACLVGAGLLAGSLAGLAWGVDHGYPAIAVFMVTLTIGLRTVMTICAVALVGAMPSNRTSLGTALNDTAQEVGTSVGTAVVGTLIATLVTVTLPDGRWSRDLVASFFHGERITFAILAVIVGLVAGWGALTLTDSRSTEEHPDAAEVTPHSETDSVFAARSAADVNA